MVILRRTELCQKADSGKAFKAILSCCELVGLQGYGQGGSEEVQHRGDVHLRDPGTLNDTCWRQLQELPYEDNTPD